MIAERVVIVIILDVLTLLALRHFITSLGAFSMFLQMVFGSCTWNILSCIFITRVGNILVN